MLAFIAAFTRRVTGEMVEYVRGALESVVDAIEKNLTDGTLKRVQR
jgi:hypothetical protein